MLPSGSDLEFFIEVAHTGNISRAAERLGVTQPALSHAIKRLESNFGQKLLHRSKSGVTLTRAGDKLKGQARTLLEMWGDILGETSKDESELRGSYSLGCHPSVALYTLGHFIPQLLSEYTELDFKFTHDLSRKICEKIISFQLDLGIVVNPVEHPDLVIKELYKDEVRLFQSSKRKSNQDVLILDADLIQAQEIAQKLKKKKMSFKRTLQTSSLEVICKLVASGAGIGIIPTTVAHEYSQKDLVPLKESPIYRDRICLVYRMENARSESFSQLTKFIYSSLRKH